MIKSSENDLYIERLMTPWRRYFLCIWYSLSWPMRVYSRLLSKWKVSYCVMRAWVCTTNI